MTAYDTAIDADSPAAHYKLGEASGTTLTARVGPAGLYETTAKITYGVAGLIAGNSTDTCVTFTRGASAAGGCGRVSQANAQATFDAAQFSYECWLSPTGASTPTNQNVMSRTTHGFYLSPSNVPGIFCGPTGANNYLAAAGLTAGVTYHLVHTFDGTTHVVYQNAVAVITQVQSRVTGGPFGIADYATTSQDTAAATMDEVAVYNTALTSSQVAAHHNAGIATADNTTKPALPGMFTPQLVEAGWF